MTIREKILEVEIANSTKRLEALEDMGMPTIVIDSMRSSIESMKSGDLKISGDTEVLEDEYISGETKKGRGGKMYVCINGSVNYFPNAKYGRYIKRV